MGTAFELGGWGMYPTMCFGVLLLAAAVRYAVKPEARWVPLTVSLGLLTFFAGMLGFLTGLIRNGLHAGPQADFGTAFMGFSESLINVALAFVLLVLAALCGALGALRIAWAPAHRPEPGASPR